MFFGRVLGWALLAATVIMASADAVMALGPADYAGIITADVVTLLTGGAPDMPTVAPSLGAQALALLMEMPAWVVTGVAGTALIVASRPRGKRRRFR